MSRSSLKTSRTPLTIKAKFTILSVGVSVLLIGMSTMGYLYVRDTNLIFEEFISIETPRLLLLTDIRDSTLRLEKEIGELFSNESLLYEDLINHQNKLLSISAEIDADSAEYQKLLEKNSRKEGESVAELSELKEDLIVAVVDEIRSRGTNESTSSAGSLLTNRETTTSVRVDRLTDYINKTIQNELSYQRDNKTRILREASFASYLSFGELVILILLLVFIQIYILRSVLRPVAELHDAVLSIAKGNFNKTLPIRTQDEIGELGMAFNSMSASLKESREKLEKRTSELITEEAKLEFLVRALPVGVAVINATDGKTTLMNEKGVALLGRGIDPKADLSNGSEAYNLRKEDGSLYPAEELAPTVALRTGLPAESNDVYVKHPDNTVVVLKTVASPLKDSNGKVVSVVVVFDDITKEQEIDKAKTEFVSLASHQLRTPLSTINWYTEMLMAGDAGPVNENQKKFLSEIYLGSTRMVDLVNALLNVSRLELGTFVIEPEPTDMIALARSVMDEQKPQLDERKQKLIPKLDKTLPVMHVDPKLMRMVVQNLLSNAIKYTPEEGTIELTLSFDEKKKNMLLKVSDNGYGITKSQQNQIFMKLFRADNVKAKDTVGTGLGLYIVKSIVEHSDGKICFESEEDKGTTFIVSLPLSGMKKKEGEKSLS